MLQKKPSVAIVSDLAFEPPSEGSRKRIKDLVEMYERLGADINYIYVGSETASVLAMRERLSGNLHHVDPGWMLVFWRLQLKFRKYLAALLGLNGLRNYRLDSWFPASIYQKIDTVLSGMAVDIVQVEYVYLSKVLTSRHLRGVRKIIDSHDVFADRWRIFPRSERPNLWYSVSRDEEVSGLARADAVLALTKADCSKLDCGNGVSPYIVGLTGQPYADRPINFSGKFLFLGSSNRMNRSGVHWLRSEVLPLVRQSMPDFKLSIAGTICDVLEPDDSIELLGRFESLSELFRGIAVLLNPVDIGSGLPIKCVDALSFGVPIISTPNGARGLESFFGAAIHIGRSADEFAQLVVRLREDACVVKESSQAASRVYTSEYFLSLEQLRQATAL